MHVAECIYIQKNVHTHKIKINLKQTHTDHPSVKRVNTDIKYKDHSIINFLELSHTLWEKIKAMCGTTLSSQLPGKQRQADHEFQASLGNL